MNFENAKNSYRKNAVVQKQMSERLIKFLVGNKFDEILEIGSGTGFLTDKIVQNLKFKNLILNDMTDNFTGHLPSKYIKGDINKIELPQNLDLIISNAVFQWILDYNFLFGKLYSSLKSGGLLAFSTFGEKNFSQIKDITGIGLDYPNIYDFLKNTGFKVLYFEQELKTLYFKDVKDVLNHIKLTGVKVKNGFWTKSDFQNFKEKYLEKYKDNLGFELTYHPIYYVAKKY